MNKQSKELIKLPTIKFSDSDLNEEESLYLLREVSKQFKDFHESLSDIMHIIDNCYVGRYTSLQDCFRLHGLFTYPISTQQQELCDELAYRYYTIISEDINYCYVFSYEM